MGALLRTHAEFTAQEGLMMLYSMLIRLAMVAVTAGLVLWIGWTVPTSPLLVLDDTSQLNQLDMNVSPSTDPLPHSKTAPTAMIESPQTRPSPRPVPRALDLNLASQRDLEGLPGIGPILAVRIVRYRETRGAFQDVEQLRRVKGIGKKTFDRIRVLVDVSSSHATQPRRKAA